MSVETIGEDMLPPVIYTKAGLLTDKSNDPVSFPLQVLAGEEDTPPSELNIPDLEVS